MTSRDAQLANSGPSSAMTSARNSVRDSPVLTIPPGAEKSQQQQASILVLPAGDHDASGSGMQVTVASATLSTGVAVSELVNVAPPAPLPAPLPAHLPVPLPAPLPVPPSVTSYSKPASSEVSALDRPLREQRTTTNYTESCSPNMTYSQRRRTRGPSKSNCVAEEDSSVSDFIFSSTPSNARPTESTMLDDDVGILCDFTTKDEYMTYGLD